MLTRSSIPNTHMSIRLTCPVLKRRSGYCMATELSQRTILSFAGLGTQGGKTTRSRWSCQQERIVLDPGVRWESSTSPVCSRVSFATVSRQHARAQQRNTAMSIDDNEQMSSICKVNSSYMQSQHLKWLFRSQWIDR